MPRRSDARAKLIETAMRLFRAKGYHGVGLTELLTTSGAPKGSFYHHFPGGKEELGEATLRAAGDFVGDLIDACFTAAGAEAEAVDKLTTAIAAYFQKSNFRAGCPIASVALDTVPQSARLTAAARDVLADWQRRAIGHAARWGRDEASSREFAERFVIALEGAWMIARIRQSASPFGHVSKMMGCDTRHG